jgi:hypothetical protein
LYSCDKIVFRETTPHSPAVLVSHTEWGMVLVWRRRAYDCPNDNELASVRLRIVGSADAFGAANKHWQTCGLSHIFVGY